MALGTRKGESWRGVLAGGELRGPPWDGGTLPSHSGWDTHLLPRAGKHLFTELRPAWPLVTLGHRGRLGGKELLIYLQREDAWVYHPFKTQTGRKWGCC